LQDGEAADVSLRARERLVVIQQANALFVNISSGAEWHTVVLAHPPLSVAIVTGACWQEGNHPAQMDAATNSMPASHPCAQLLFLSFMPFRLVG
jgi:hypothetical protein